VPDREYNDLLCENVKNVKASKSYELSDKMTCQAKQVIIWCKMFPILHVIIIVAMSDDRSVSLGHAKLRLKSNCLHVN